MMAIGDGECRVAGACVVYDSHGSPGGVERALQRDKSGIEEGEATVIVGGLRALLGQGLTMTINGLSGWNPTFPGISRAAGRIG